MTTQKPLICPFTIYIDTAEQHPFPFIGMRADSDQDRRIFTVNTEKKCLGRHPNSLGDYSLEGGIGRCHIERKSISDLQSTLLGFTDGHRERFVCELDNLSKIEAPLLIVEGSLDDLLKHAPDYGKRSPQDNAKNLFRSVIAISQDYKVPTFFAGSRGMAELTTFRWMYRFWEKKLKVELKAVQRAEKILETI